MWAMWESACQRRCSGSKLSFSSTWQTWFVTIPLSLGSQPVSPTPFKKMKCAYSRSSGVLWMSCDSYPFSLFLPLSLAPALLGAQELFWGITFNPPPQFWVSVLSPCPYKLCSDRYQCSEASCTVVPSAGTWKASPWHGRCVLCRNGMRCTQITHLKFTGQKQALLPRGTEHWNLWFNSLSFLSLPLYLHFSCSILFGALIPCLPVSSPLLQCLTTTVNLLGKKGKDTRWASPQLQTIAKIFAMRQVGGKPQ